MKPLLLIFLILTTAFGIFLFVYGGYDDSPGAQLLGLVIAGTSIWNAVRRRKKA